MDDFWGSFLAQLIATLAGAIVGVLAAYYFQERTTRRDSVDRAIERVLLRIGDLTHALSAREPSDRDSIAIAFELLIITARGHDREIAGELSECWDYLARGRNAGNLPAACSFLTAAIREWRKGAPTTAVRKKIMLAQRLVD